MDMVYIYGYIYLEIEKIKHHILNPFLKHVAKSMYYISKQSSPIVLECKLASPIWCNSEVTLKINWVEKGTSTLNDIIDNEDKLLMRWCQNGIYRVTSCFTVD